MIVFRDQRVPADPTHLLSAIRLDVSRWANGSPPPHDAAVRLLINMGKLEAALADAIFPEHDGFHPVTRRLRQASCALGHVLWHTWRGQAAEARCWLAQAAATLAHLELQPLPQRVLVVAPEGYAHYAVYPEMYLEAARRCYEILGPFNAVCLGLRSIGTSLSAVVHGALEEQGCKVASYTLRPRGHPFTRRPVVTSQLQMILQAERDAVFLVVDEGPGISGSSLAGTADLLSDLGIEDERIVLFPSWATDGAELRSPDARARWPRHRQFIATFEEVWLNSGRLSQRLPTGRLRDFSAGAWRDELYDDPAAFPPIQPQHERRKYLLESFSGPHSERTSRWLTFVGLDSPISAKLARAEQLAAAGFTTAPEMVANGFLVRPFTPGAPVSRQEGVEPELLETMASYLAYISREHPAEPSVTDTSLREMVSTNVAKGLGDRWLSRLDSSLSGSAAGWCERPVALDGRMLPHEWIRTAQGYLKTDAVDHCDDHFFPGCQDIAWDVVAACLEFGLPPDNRRRLIQRYRVLSGDRTIASRLPLHAVTYLAFRLGYATMAAGTLGGTPDGMRFAGAAERYQELLKSELVHAQQDRWDA